MTVRELIEELKRFDPNATVVTNGPVGGRGIVMDVGRRERDGIVQPQIYVDDATL